MEFSSLWIRYNYLKKKSNCLHKCFVLGKRRCLGEALAKTNLFLFFTALLHNFILEKEDFDAKLSMNGFDGVTISPKPFKAKLIPRKD